MLKEYIDKLRNKVIHLLGGYTEIVRLPEHHTALCTTVYPEQMKVAVFPPERIPSNDYIEHWIAENITRMLMGKNVIAYSVGREQNRVVVYGKIQIVKNMLEGETDNVEEVMEKIRVSDVWSRSGSGDI